MGLAFAAVITAFEAGHDLHALPQQRAPTGRPP
jgi:hypothetical protein